MNDKINATDREKINLLMQDVVRLNEANMMLQKQMINLVTAVQSGFDIINKELTRIAKLP